ncbi:mitochondrial 2-oxoglutarate/malate carrier protein isoform X2 [Andrena cerasifolii]|uniref:mitochondrial 2-oxoglutarate/malate carrier protein isoform X2 n=1 Tax=Andrena cerasifolii TaxID=2819439 RepID=UPI004037767A
MRNSWILRWLERRSCGERLTFTTMVGLGMISGIMSAFIGTPTDLVLVRKIADVHLPPEQRWNYRNICAALLDIWETEGLCALWRGAVPTMTRAAITTGSQLGTFTKAKLTLQETGYLEEGMLLQICSAMISGLAVCTTSLPVDVVKTRIQNWDSPKVPPGIIGMAINIRQKEGILSLWRGFLPYYARSAPITVITMICVTEFHRIYTDLFVSCK